MGQYKKKQRKIAPTGIANIKTTFNNTLVTLCDQLGGVICWCSTGVVGFKGTRKSTPFAGQVAAKTAATKAIELGLKEVSVVIKGRGGARESATRGLSSAGLKILSLADATSFPHNGCRPPKRRRL